MPGRRLNFPCLYCFSLALFGAKEAIELHQWRWYISIAGVQSSGSYEQLGFSVGV